MTRRSMLLCLLLSMAACSDEGDLSGSLTEVYRLEHDFVRARLYPSELSIEYGLDNGSVPIRVTLRLKDATLKEGDEYDLGEAGAITGQLSDGTLLPKLIDGDLSLKGFEEMQGADISGTFDAKFDGSRDTLSLAGKFSTTLDIIDWPKSPDAGTGEEAP